MHTYAANVWDLCVVQGPFSVAPLPNPINFCIACMLVGRGHSRTNHPAVHSFRHIHLFQVWLAAFKLEFENKEPERARLILAKVSGATTLFRVASDFVCVYAPSSIGL